MNPIHEDRHFLLSLCGKLHVIKWTLASFKCLRYAVPSADRAFPWFPIPHIPLSLTLTQHNQTVPSKVHKQVLYSTASCPNSPARVWSAPSMLHLHFQPRWGTETLSLVKKSASVNWSHPGAVQAKEKDAPNQRGPFKSLNFQRISGRK